MPPPVPASVRALHGRGLSQSEIARRLGVARCTVAAAMRRLGLRPNHRRGQYDHARVLRCQGYRSLVQIRWSRSRIEGEYRWPRCGVTRAEASVLDALAYGPRTVDQVRRHLGVGANGVRRILRSLLVRGLVGRPPLARRDVPWALAGRAADALARRRHAFDLD